MPDGNLDLTQGTAGSTLALTVDRNGGQITGTISDAEGRQTTGRHLFVVLAADVNSFSTWRTAISSDSTFEFRGVKPGSYRLFAVDPIQFGGLSSYEPLKGLGAKAEQIEVKAGARIGKNLRLAAREGVVAK